MDVFEITKLCVTGVSVILSIFMVILYLISKKAKRKEVKEKAQDALETTQQVFDLFYLVKNAVIGAEKNANYNAVEKFNFAFTAVKNELFKQNKVVEDATLTDMIENEIIVSENVNSDEHQKMKQSELKKIKIS